MKKILESIYDMAYGWGVGGMYTPMFDTNGDFTKIKKILKSPDRESDILELLKSLHDKAFEAGWSTIVGSTETGVIKDIGAEKEAAQLKGDLIKSMEKELLKIK